MTYSGFGDLARTSPLTRHGIQAREDLSRLARELTTGRHDDVAQATRGDLRPLSGIERSIVMLGGHEAATTSLQGRMGVMQASLGALRSAAEQAAGDLLMVAGPSGSAAMNQALPIAESAFGASVSALRVRYGVNHVFSGRASDQTPMPGPEALLKQLRDDVGAAAITDPTALSTAVEAWFAPGGGLDAAFPLPGGDRPMVVTVAPGDDVRVDPTAADPSIRATLATLATAVLAGEGGGLDREGQRVALNAAAETLFSDLASLSEVQGRLGAAEGRSEQALTRVRAEITALEIARGEVLEVDRYETATKMQTVEAGVEALYLVTARLADLSLARYLR